MGRYLNGSDLRRMGYVCRECGKVANILKSCPRGCTKVCPDCLREKVYSWSTRSFVSLHKLRFSDLFRVGIYRPSV